MARQNLVKPKLAIASKKGERNIGKMERTVKESRLGYSMSYEAQGRFVVMNGVTYYNQISYDIYLHDNNYHLVVNLLIKLFCDRNSMRFEAPEWYPTKEMFGKSGKECENMNVDKGGDLHVNEKSEKVNNGIKVDKEKVECKKGITR